MQIPRLVVVFGLLAATTGCVLPVGPMCCPPCPQVAHTPISPYGRFPGPVAPLTTMHQTLPPLNSQTLLPAPLPANWSPPVQQMTHKVKSLWPVTKKYSSHYDPHLVSQIAHQCTCDKCRTARKTKHKHGHKHHKCHHGCDDCCVSTSCCESAPCESAGCCSACSETPVTCEADCHHSTGCGCGCSSTHEKTCAVPAGPTCAVPADSTCAVPALEYHSPDCAVPAPLQSTDDALQHGYDDDVPPPVPGSGHDDEMPEPVPPPASLPPPSDAPAERSPDATLPPADEVSESTDAPQEETDSDPSSENPFPLPDAETEPPADGGPITPISYTKEHETTAPVMVIPSTVVEKRRIQ